MLMLYFAPQTCMVHANIRYITYAAIARIFPRTHIHKHENNVTRHNSKKPLAWAQIINDDQYEFYWHTFSSRVYAAFAVRLSAQRPCGEFPNKLCTHESVGRMRSQMYTQSNAGTNPSATYYQKQYDSLNNNKTHAQLFRPADSIA